ncbi:MAG: hypothetical protein P1V51_19350 [Deltaproteobacteria bacterium]|nr:hypothetical protein [Deltaproteobacteria bacterium]
MNSKFFVTAMMTALVALVGMGSDCEVPDNGDGGTNTDGGGGTDGGGNDGGGGDCVTAGTCNPNKYADSDMGVYDTGNYGLLLLDTNGDTVPDTPAIANGDISRVNAYAMDQAIEYWLLSEVDSNGFLVDTFAGVNTFLNRVYVILDSTGAKSGRSVITEAPDGTYSPLFQIFYVHTPAGYTADTMKSEASITNAAADPETGVWVQGTNQVWVIQIVDSSVGLAGATGANDPELRPAWLGGFTVYGYAIPGGNSDGTMPTANDSTDPDNVPPDPYLSDLWTFKQQSQPLCAGRNVYLDVYGGLGYSPVPVLHPYLVPNGTCAQIPTNDADVVQAILDGTYTENPNRGDIVVVTPQSP